MDNLEDLQAQIVQNQELKKQLKEALDKIKELEHTIEENEIIYLNGREFDRLLDDLYMGDISTEKIQKLAAGKYEFTFNTRGSEEDIQEFKDLIRESVMFPIGKEKLGEKEENEYTCSYYYNSNEDAFFEVKDYNYEQVNYERRPIVNTKEIKAPKGFKDFWNKLENFELSQQEVNSFRKKLKANDITFLNVLDEKLECNEKCLKSEEIETFKIYKTLAKKIESKTITPKEYYDDIFKIEGLKEDIYVPEKYTKAVEDYLVNMIDSEAANCMYELHSDGGVIRDGHVSGFGDYYDTVEEFDNILFDNNYNALVHHYGCIYDGITEVEHASVSRAPEWFKPGFEGVNNKTLKENEFIDFLSKLDDEKEIGLSGCAAVQLGIRKFLEYLEKNKDAQRVMCCAISSTNEAFFENVKFSEDIQYSGKLNVVHLPESNKYLELFVSNVRGVNLQIQILDNLEKSYLNTLLESEGVLQKDFIQLLEQNNLNKLGLSTGIDSFIQKYEKRAPDAIFKVSELLPDTLKTPSFEKFSDNLLIKMEGKVFAYRPPTEHHISVISAPFNDNEMTHKLDDVSKTRELTQQHRNECSKRQEDVAKTRTLSTLEKKEIADIKQNIQEKRITVAAKIEDYESKKTSVEQLEGALETRRSQKNQLVVAINNTLRNIRTKKESKNALQKSILEQEATLHDIKEEIEIHSDLQNFRQQNNENRNLNDCNSVDKLKNMKKIFNPITLEMGDK